MNTTIRKVTSAGKGETVAVFTTQAENFNTSYFSKPELDYIKSEIKKKGRLISVNQYHRQVFLQIVDLGNQDLYRQKELLRKAGDQLTSALNRSKSTSVCIVADLMEEHAAALIEGMVLGNYQFLKHKTKSESNSLTRLNVICKQLSADKISEVSTVCDAVYQARNLVNEPVNILSASALSDAFRNMGKKAGFKVKVFNKTEIKSMKMGGLLAVNKGSVDPPTFTVMEYKSPKAKNKKPFVLVGKGVVYDTGGLSLKPTPGSMDYMKSDMAGAAAVGSTMYAIAKMKLPIHVIALVPATDNRPDGNAYAPGDVITMMSGLKVEVLNTDAEGRMILADALHYAKRYKPELVMEFSTLTGAAANAIGHYGIVAMGDCDEKTLSDLKTSANNVYERLVEFPFWEEYDELIKSDIADIKNIGGPIGGAITAGRFLQRFIEYPYMHFDIAGPSFGKSNDSYRGKNGSGVGVRFMFDFLKHKSGKK